ncbi:trimethylamine methyltransferase family protein [candidate division KSB1 bacterium]|nr:trimethylamine methyltransferase family protein [candidate division KSB1 bacterium]
MKTQILRPKLKLLSEKLASSIVDEATQVLEKVGVRIENAQARGILRDHGQKVRKSDHRAFFSRSVVEGALRTVPKSITIYDRDGEAKLFLEKDNVYFNPGSAALKILDYEKGSMREPVTRDFLNLCRVVEGLSHIQAQSTALICADVPKGAADSYRLYLALKHCRKPVVTGTFAKESFGVMKNMLVVVRGSEEELRNKPLAIFDVCPSPPLKWSDLTCQALLDCGRYGVPAELVAMPLAGGNAPVTLTGTLVQHTAENLAGIVISQLAHPGAPIIYGGSPAILDMSQGTTPMGAMETWLIDCAYTQIGKFLGLPTHAYMGLSDAKLGDYQAGLESGMGTLLASLAGVNVVSGAGMLNFESAQSLEKLVLDNEICGSAYRLVQGITQRETPMALDLLAELCERGDFLSHPHTLKWFRKEFHFPSRLLDRGTAGGKSSAWERAHQRVSDLLTTRQECPLPEGVEKELTDLMTRELQKFGMDYLPINENY